MSDQHETTDQPVTTDTPDPSNTSNTEKPTEQWVTGDEPMTGAQASYLQTLCAETGHDFDPDLSKAAASDLIDRLQDQSDRLG